VISILKISLIDVTVKFQSNQIISISAQDIEFLSNACLIKKKHKKYLLYLNYHEYQIICPIEKNENGEFSVLIPAFKIPNSNIPIFVHMYAVGMYISTRESMRKIVAKVKKKFGLVTFCHTTLSRTLKKMITRVGENQEYFTDEKTEVNLEISSHDKKAVDECKDNIKVVARRHWQLDYIEKAKILLNFLLPVIA
jgi:hypothetical protein